MSKKKLRKARRLPSERLYIRKAQAALGFIQGFAEDEGGAAAAEYALLLAIIAAGLAVAAGTLGTAISDSLNTSAGCIDGTGTC